MDGRQRGRDKRSGIPDENVKMTQKRASRIKCKRKREREGGILQIREEKGGLREGSSEMGEKKRLEQSKRHYVIISDFMTCRLCTVMYSYYSHI